MPTDPQPGATPGFAVRTPNTAPSQTHIMIEQRAYRPLRAHRRLGHAGAARRRLHRGPPQRGGQRCPSRIARADGTRRGLGPSAPAPAAAESFALPAAAWLLPVRSVAGTISRRRPGRKRARQRCGRLGDGHRPQASALDAPGGPFYFCTRRWTTPAWSSVSRSPSPCTSTSTRRQARASRSTPRTCATRQPRIS